MLVLAHSRTQTGRQTGMYVREHAPDACLFQGTESSRICLRHDDGLRPPSAIPNPLPLPAVLVSVSVHAAASAGGAAGGAGTCVRVCRGYGGT